MKQNICKLEEYTNYKISLCIQRKDPVKRSYCSQSQCYLREVCKCKEFYIGETKRNLEVR